MPQCATTIQFILEIHLVDVVHLDTLVCGSGILIVAVGTLLGLVEQLVLLLREKTLTQALLRREVVNRYILVYYLPTSTLVHIGTTLQRILAKIVTIRHMLCIRQSAQLLLVAAAKR